MSEDMTEVLRRRFGRNHADPCHRPEVLTCSLWECQRAGYCQFNLQQTLGTGIVVTLPQPPSSNGE